ncbi:histone deacetylase HDT1-like [Impatiens glandulifera]|uniref:histone deacetylase HDT1-like n=1 Tax=Impatiens glandulifera TaxID=253017 RepID=UPI001FB07629|nr:histone deacetylase HDT1-like [Impatiens glandulifera]
MVIDEDDVQCILNIPRGEIDVTESIGKNSDGPEYLAILRAWRMRWVGSETSGAPIISSMPEVILANTTADDDFKRDFVVYAVSSFLWATESPTCSIILKRNFHRFDKFNPKYNSCGQSRLREIFFKQDNLIQLLDEDDDEEDEDEEFVPTLIPDVAKVEAAKPIATKAKTAAKQKVSIVEPKNDSSDESEDDSDEDMEGDSDDSDDDKDDFDDEEETTTPKKSINDKNRANDSASKTPVQAKKAKADTTPQKKDGKKVAHVATPHPVKKGTTKPKICKGGRD